MYLYLIKQYLIYIKLLMNHRKHYQSSETLRSYSSVDTNNTNSPLDSSFVILTENSKPQKTKVTFNPKVEIIKIKSFKKWNLKNSILTREIYNNLIAEKKRRIQENFEKEEEARRQENCNGCFIY